jgi:hypothetical protein
MSTWYGGTWRSTDGGDTWSLTSGLPSVGYTSTVGDFAELDGVYYAAVTGFSWASGTTGVYASTDEGATWADASTGLPANVAVDGLDVADGVVFAVTDGVGGGVFRRDPSSGTWSELGSGVDDFVSGPLRIVGTDFLLGTDARGLWRMEGL